MAMMGLLALISSSGRAHADCAAPYSPEDCHCVSTSVVVGELVASEDPELLQLVVDDQIDGRKPTVVGDARVRLDRGYEAGQRVIAEVYSDGSVGVFEVLDGAEMGCNAEIFETERDYAEYLVWERCPDFLVSRNQATAPCNDVVGPFDCSFEPTSAGDTPWAALGLLLGYALVLRCRRGRAPA